MASAKKIDVAALIVSLLALLISTTVGIRSLVLSDEANDPLIVTSPGSLRPEVQTGDGAMAGRETLYCKDTISFANIGGGSTTLNEVEITVTIGAESSTSIDPILSGAALNEPTGFEAAPFWHVMSWAWSEEGRPMVLSSDGDILVVNELQSELEYNVSDIDMQNFERFGSRENILVGYVFHFTNHPPVRVPNRSCAFFQPAP